MVAAVTSASSGEGQITACRRWGRHASQRLQKQSKLPQRPRRSMAIAAVHRRHDELSQPQQLGGGVLTACLAVLQLSAVTGAAVAEPAEADAPRAPRLPSLPSPPEIVRSLSEQLSSFTNNGDAPSLTDSPDATPSSDVKPPGDDQATDDQPRVPEQGSELDRLMNKFERTILPKIKDQIASLDQQDNPNQAMIELRRELTTAEQDIKKLVEDAKRGDSDSAHAEAQQLQREFASIREYITKNGGELVN